MPGPDEIELSGGNASGAVMRVGQTVRKPWQTTTGYVMAFLRVLREKGIDVPEHFGQDEQGRQVIEYVPGRLATESAPLDPATLREVGRLIRSIHEASAELPIPDDWPVLLPAEGPDLICHNDLATWNLVLDEGRLVFIDWDGAGPSTRLWDLADAAISFAHLFPGADVADCQTRLRALLDGYAADPPLRAALPAALPKRARAMYDMLRRAYVAHEHPWAAMYLDGHGDHWRAASDFIGSHEADWTNACR